MYENGNVDLDSLNEFEKLEYLENIMIERATGGTPCANDYKALRNYFANNPEYKSKLPKIIKSHYNLQAFWEFIKYEFGSYSQRRFYIWEELKPFKAFLESDGHVLDDDLTKTNEKFDCEYINEKWKSAIENIESDPERVITLARTILESTCKHILSELNEDTVSHDLPKLYKIVAEKLNLAPSMHHEEIFKRILGGCHSVVEGIGTLRNNLSDAHGTTKKVYKVMPRHAKLAISLSASMSIFLLETFEAINSIE